MVWLLLIGVYITTVVHLDQHTLSLSNIYET